MAPEDSHPAPPTPGPVSVRFSARHLGERIDVRSVREYPVEAWSPLVLRVRESAWVVLFRYGTAVSVGLDPEEEVSVLADLAPYVSEPFGRVGHEDVTVRIDPDHEELLDQTGTLWLPGTEVERLQILAEVMAKSTAMAHFEAEVGGVLSQIEPMILRMSKGRDAVAGQRRLLAQLGEVLATQARVIGRVEVTEKPELAWNDPALNRLYERLAAEFELSERDTVLTRKMGFISSSVGVLLEMAQQRQSLRVEWYIVILIVIEILLLVFDMWIR